MNAQERIEALEAEFNEKIKALKTEMSREKEFPRDGDEYWYIDSEGDVLSERWDSLDFEEYGLAIGNVFKTEEQAEFAAEKLRVEAELRKFGDSWDLELTQYSFSFDWECGELKVEYPDYNQYPNSYYFYSIDDLQQAVSTVGEERIKKYIFGVEG